MLLMFVLIFGSSMGAFATFKPPIKTYTLNVVVDSGSTEMGYVMGSGQYPKDQIVPVSATANEGYHFVKWMINIHGDGQPAKDYDRPQSFEYKMPNKDVTLTAFFKADPVLTLSVNNPELGEIEGEEGSYPPGTEITLHANPIVRGSKFIQWVFTPAISPESTDVNEVTFKMPCTDLHVEAVFEMQPLRNVMLIPHPDDKGNPELDEGALPAEDPFDGMYYKGEKFQVHPNPVPNWHFVGYTWEKIYEDESEADLKMAVSNGENGIVYDSTDPDYWFTMGCSDLAITVHYKEDYNVNVIFEYHNTQGGEIKPDSAPSKVYLGPYSFIPDVIPGWQHIYSTPNVSGTITNDSEDFIVTYVYQVPPTPTVITETVVVTETVTVTVPAPTETVTEEEVPLAPVSAPLDLDSIYDQTPPPPTAPAEDIDLEEVPLADALPQTGQIPAEGFYGIGGLISAIGIYLKKRSFK